ncbi:TetR family transcriptional regulator [Mycobacterium florentinum]|uniref:TetR family transcriptional regulator n=1 Tax=Mycobacterium florentinum TaxID=292462 RepID=A0A1X1UC18_MYCFL|nr:TetR/AcrR family transcriptional regulator [Mycobacterium florentinum]MCV7412400.1 TetR/AcrR family transcriptional regulator [Mycobacterium florentinum]ORV54387.1 TetR family transcriptional regulator [Mycobacterium florentinum]BBX81782.1 TetR family transcriptional regulator [Mycobacterium florentinum]
MTDMTRRAVGRRRVVDTEASVAESIFSATARLLAREPFSDVSVAQILTEAGVSRATFYFYFSSKFSVLSGLLERAMNDIFETVQPFLARSPEDSPTVALQRSIRAVTQAWHRHRPVLQAANHHWHAEPELRNLWLGITERFISAGAAEIDRERAAGIITSPVPSRTLAATLFWGTERVLYIAGLGVEPNLADEEAAVDVLVTMWRGTLYAPA